MRKRNRFCVSLLAVLLPVLLWGCDQGEQIRTVVLPPQENHMLDADKLRINHIQTYVGAGHSEDNVTIAWGEPGTDLLYQLICQDGEYLYQTLNTRTDTVENTVTLADHAISSVRISPGGRYLSYEVWEGSATELVVFCPEQESRQVLYMWNNDGEDFAYVWSGDGTKLFSWQYTTGEPSYWDWQVTCYGMMSGPDGSFQVEKAQFQMEGHGEGIRTVLPNADGSQVYVRDQFHIYDASREEKKTAKNQQEEQPENENRDAKEYQTYTIGASAAAAAGLDALYLALGKDAVSNSAGLGNVPSAETDKNVDAEEVTACNWLILPEEARMLELTEYSSAAVVPLKYTPAGLFFQEEDGTVCLVEDLLDRPVVKELLRPNMEYPNPMPCVCENGDHIFLTEYINNTVYEVSGLRIVDGQAEGEPIVLYRDNFDNLDAIEVLFDGALVLWGGGYLDKNWYSFKITALEY